MNCLLFIVGVIISAVLLALGIVLKRQSVGTEATRLGIRNRIDGTSFLAAGICIFIFNGLWFAYDYGMHNCLCHNLHSPAIQ